MEHIQSLSPLLHMHTCLWDMCEGAEAFSCFEFDLIRAAAISLSHTQRAKNNRLGSEPSKLNSGGLNETQNVIRKRRNQIFQTVILKMKVEIHFALFLRTIRDTELFETH